MTNETDLRKTLSDLGDKYFIEPRESDARSRIGCFAMLFANFLLSLIAIYLLFQSCN